MGKQEKQKTTKKIIKQVKLGGKLSP